MIGKTSLGYAPRDRIDAFGELANEFVREILGLPWALMTDESALSDFSGCGPEDQHDPEGLDDEAHREFWDKWIVERVCGRYRIEPFSVTIPMVQLFERIQRAIALQCGLEPIAESGQNWTIDGNLGIVNNLSMDHEMRLNSNQGQILPPRTAPIRQTE